MGGVEFDVLAGTPGLKLSQVSHVLIPGRGRNHDATALNPDAEARCRTATDLHSAVGAHRLVCSGYKSPVDGKGAPWSTPEAPGEVFRGIPEADLMRTWLLSAGVDPSVISVERRSIDTVTNLLRAEHENHFGDDRPVAIVAQRGHLARILSVIAPRTLRRPFLGVVVPEPAPSRENPLAIPVSRLIVSALTRDPAAAVVTATRRAELLWGVARRLGKNSYH
jgi:hypothetical protein